MPKIRSRNLIQMVEALGDKKPPLHILLENYIRVIPRDLFNEAKLLKCYGMLSLALHNYPMEGVELEHDGDEFHVVMDDSGCLSVSNLTLVVHGEPVTLGSMTNSRDAYPLLFTDAEEEQHSLFDQAGKYSQEFLQLCHASVAPDLNRSDNPLDITEALGDKKQEILLKQFPEHDAEQLTAIADTFDPTPNKAYITWILKLIRAKSLIHPEDSAKTNEALTAFAEFRRRNVPGISNDIFSYKSFGDLAAAIEGMAGARSKREVVKAQRTEGSEIVYEEGTTVVYKITTPEAAATLCRGTKWCVKDPQYARDYLSKGPMYMVVENEVRVALAHFNGATIAINDVHDRLCEDKELIRMVDILIKIVGHDVIYRNLEIAVSHAIAKQTLLPKSVEGRLIYDMEEALLYVMNVKKERWPEFELQIPIDSYDLLDVFKYYDKYVPGGSDDLRARNKEALRKKIDATRPSPLIKPVKPESKVVKDFGDGWTVVQVNATYEGDRRSMAIQYGVPASVFASMGGGSNISHLLVHGGKTHLVVVSSFANRVEISNDDSLCRIDPAMLYWKSNQPIPDEYAIPLLKAASAAGGLDGGLDVRLTLATIEGTPLTKGDEIKASKTYKDEALLAYFKKTPNVSREGIIKAIVDFMYDYPDYSWGNQHNLLRDMVKAGVHVNEIKNQVLSASRNGSAMLPYMGPLVQEVCRKVRAVWPDLERVLAKRFLSDKVPAYSGGYEDKMGCVKTAIAYHISCPSWDHKEEILSTLMKDPRADGGVLMCKMMVSLGERASAEQEVFMGRGRMRTSKEGKAALAAYQAAFGITDKDMTAKKPEKKTRPVVLPPAPKFESVARFLKLL